MKNLKLHNANFLSYDFSHIRLNPCDRSFPCLYNLQSHSLNFSHLPQHSSFIQPRDGGSKSIASETLHPAPSMHGFRWWVTHPSHCQWLRSVIVSPSCGCYSFISADSHCLYLQSEPVSQHCAVGGERYFPDPLKRSALPRNRETVWPVWLEDLHWYLLNISGDVAPLQGSDTNVSLDRRMKNHSSGYKLPWAILLGSGVGEGNTLPTVLQSSLPIGWETHPIFLPSPGREQTQGQIQKFSLAGSGTTTSCIVSWGWNGLWPM